MTNKQLKAILEDRKTELLNKIAELDKNIASLDSAWCPEVVIRKRDGEIGFPKYMLGHGENIIIEITFPSITSQLYNSSPIKVTMEDFTREYIEYTPKVRGYYPKERK